ncbi:MULTISPECIES: hypothetical protein [Winogradskyella]|jgi:hypothetical protein|uniref:hypothetical protein n=1 Tax=Winogradskyella TaxID=286104 RepID=UPI0015CA67D2|nr:MULTISPECIES: hypothetical protein [Winogradskyella]QXP78420.1 hypothetical protein H0I32_14555 [Winogradskyella sp. HaHa_3_26]
MKKLIESLFDLFFPHDIDENGNKIENPEGDDSYSTKVFTIIILAIILILVGVVLK